MELITLFIVIGLLFLVAIGFFIFTKKIDQFKKPDDTNSFLLLQQQLGQVVQGLERRLNETNRTLDKKLSETNLLTKEQLKDSSVLIREMTEKLTKLDETNRQVVDFSSQLKNLQDILKNPKQRGVLGEYYLEETLKNVLPPSNYQMQYKFKDGAIVDAVIFVKDKIIPVDSKFSLENYEQLLACNDGNRRVMLEKTFKQDLKNRIDETAKYVRTEEKTTDFAFMFIPSESIYYDLLVNKVGTAQISSRDLIDYAFKEKHVIITSPTSFLAYLQTVLQGLRALEIEESAKEIQKNVEKLGRHLDNYQECFEKIGNSLSTTVNHYNHASKELKKVDKDVMKITDGKEGGNMKELEIEKPREEL